MRGQRPGRAVPDTVRRFPFHGIREDGPFRPPSLADELEPFLTAPAVSVGDGFGGDQPHVLVPVRLVASMFVRLVAGFPLRAKPRGWYPPAPLGGDLPVERIHFRLRRVSLKLSQKELGDLAGVPQSTVSRYEHGGDFTESTVARLRCALAAATFIRGASCEDLVALEQLAQSCTTTEK